MQMRNHDAQRRAERVLERLDAIVVELARDPQALALLGLGSVGAERERLDEFSDLDFFAIVQPEVKRRYISDLAWLERVHPLAYSFQNTRDGFKTLFADGLYAEFAVLTLEELAGIPTHRGRVIWRAADYALDLDAVSASVQPPAPAEPHTTEWLIGEILTNLYVGMMRYHRGERLSATRLIQTHAVDRLIELAPQLAAPTAATTDPFAPERRFEARFPEVAGRLPSFAQGYEHSAESALAMLAYLIEQRLPVNAAIEWRIRDLCASTAPHEVDL